MKKIITPHDKFFRASMSDRRVAKAFFETHLPEPIRRQVDLNTLQLRKETFVDPQLQKSLVDTLFSVAFGEKPGYLYLLSEHVRNPNRLLPFILLKYMIQIMDHHLKGEGGGTELPVVYPVVLYNGQSVFPYSMQVFDLFAQHQDLARQVLLGPYQLIDLNQFSDEDLKQHGWLTILELCLKYAWVRDIADIVQDLLPQFWEVERAQGDDYNEAAITYLFTVGNLGNPETLWKEIHSKLSQRLEEKIMTYAQQLRTEGRVEGEKTMLLRLLQRKFGELPGDCLQQIEQADAKTLLEWGDKLITARLLEEIFK